MAAAAALVRAASDGDRAKLAPSRMLEKDLVAPDLEQLRKGKPARGLDEFWFCTKSGEMRSLDDNSCVLFAEGNCDCVDDPNCIVRVGPIISWEISHEDTAAIHVQTERAWYQLKDAHDRYEAHFAPVFRKFIVAVAVVHVARSPTAHAMSADEFVQRVQTALSQTGSFETAPELSRVRRRICKFHHFLRTQLALAGIAHAPPAFAEIGQDDLSSVPSPSKKRKLLDHFAAMADGEKKSKKAKPTTSGENKTPLGLSPNNKPLADNNTNHKACGGNFGSPVNKQKSLTVIPVDKGRRLEGKPGDAKPAGEGAGAGGKPKPKPKSKKTAAHEPENNNSANKKSSPLKAQRNLLLEKMKKAQQKLDHEHKKKQELQEQKRKEEEERRRVQRMRFPINDDDLPESVRTPWAAPDPVPLPDNVCDGHVLTSLMACFGALDTFGPLHHLPGVEFEELLEAIPDGTDSHRPIPPLCTAVHCALLRCLMEASERAAGEYEHASLAAKRYQWCSVGFAATMRGCWKDVHTPLTDPHAWPEALSEYVALVHPEANSLAQLLCTNEYMALSRNHRAELLALLVDDMVCLDHTRQAIDDSLEGSQANAKAVVELERAEKKRAKEAQDEIDACAKELEQLRTAFRKAQAKAAKEKAKADKAKAKADRARARDKVRAAERGENMEDDKEDKEGEEDEEDEEMREEDDKEIRRKQAALDRLQSRNLQHQQRYDTKMGQLVKKGEGLDAHARRAPLGYDRERRAYWWLDGQLPGRFLYRADSHGNWARFEGGPADVALLVAQLNDKGEREAALKAALGACGVCDNDQEGAASVPVVQSRGKRPHQAPRLVLPEPTSPCSAVRRTLCELVDSHMPASVFQPDAKPQADALRSEAAECDDIPQLTQLLARLEALTNPSSLGEEWVADRPKWASRVGGGGGGGVLPSHTLVALVREFEDAVADKASDSACCVCQREGFSKTNHILLCDSCNKGFHMRCLTPVLRRVPNGQWFCPECVRARKQREKEEQEAQAQERRSGLRVTRQTRRRVELVCDDDSQSSVGAASDQASSTRQTRSTRSGASSRGCGRTLRSRPAAAASASSRSSSPAQSSASESESEGESESQSESEEEVHNDDDESGEEEEESVVGDGEDEDEDEDEDE